MQPDASALQFDLDRRLASVVRIHSRIPSDAFSASALGTEREGSGVLVSERGIVLTIGYLINEADEIWLTTSTGRVVPGHALATDFATGFGIVQALGQIDRPVMPIGRSADVGIGAELVVAAGTGLDHAMRSRLIGKREFAGYWEYLLDEAFFTMPAHPAWGGSAVIGPQGDLVGIGSLLVQVGNDESSTEDSNMIVPIDLLAPIFEDLVKKGRTETPARPWLGIFSSDSPNGVTVVNVADGGPGDLGGVRDDDIILAVDDVPVGDLADFYRQLWAGGEAGMTVDLTILRDDKRHRIKLRSADRNDFLRRPRLH